VNRMLPVVHEPPLEGEFVGKDDGKRAFYKGAYGGHLSPAELIAMRERVMMFSTSNTGRASSHDDIIDIMHYCLGDVKHTIHAYGLAWHLQNLSKSNRIVFVGIDPASGEDMTVFAKVRMTSRHDADVCIIDDILSASEYYIPAVEEVPLTDKAKHTAELNKMRQKMRGKRKW